MKADERIKLAILTRLEEANTPNAALNAKDVPGFSEQEVAYNMMLLSEAGYIKAAIKEVNLGGDQRIMAMAIRLTNSGHELLDTIRKSTKTL